MKKGLLFSLFLLFGVVQSSVFATIKEVEEMSVYYKKETIGSQVFVYREDVVNGVKKEAWNIDGEAIGADDYEEQLWQAEKEARQKDRAVRAEKRRARQESELQIAQALQKKLLRLEIERIEAGLDRFDDHRLVPFLVFDDALSKEQFEKIETELLSEARILLRHLNVDTIVDLKTILNKLEGVSDRLELCFQKTVNNAVNRCDDTKVLKELLNFLSVA